MSDDDLIRRGDALAVLDEYVGWGDDTIAAIRAIPATDAREAMQELIDAYEDIMDYGIVFAKKPQQDRLNAAKAKLKETQ